MASKISKFIKAITKVGLSAGFVYFTEREGLWGSSEQAISFYLKLWEMTPKTIKDTAIDMSDGVANSTKQIAIWSNPNHTPLTERWNNAVITSTRFLVTLPEYVQNWIN